MRKNLLLLVVCLLAMGRAWGLTVEQADSVILARFTDRFESYYEQYVLVYDGTSFFTATALARSGRRENGACGYDLTNTSIAATTASGVDSAGAYEEGCTVMRVDAAGYPSILSLQTAVEAFIYANVQDTALLGVAGDPGDKGSGIFRACPNPFREQVKFSAPPGSGRMVLIYDVTGALKRVLERNRTESGPLAWDGRDSGGRPLPAGVYLVRMPEGGRAIRVVKF